LTNGWQVSKKSIANKASQRAKPVDKLNLITTLASGLGLYFLGISLGLYMPDLDLLLMSLLHQRSILTHSLIIPGAVLLIFKLLGKGGRLTERTCLLGHFFGLGLCVGVSIHLAADVLSPMKGFALIYLPLVKTSIGGELSLLWMGGNAVLAAYLAMRLTNRFLPLNAVVFVVVAMAYANLNEGDFMALLSALLILMCPYIVRNAQCQKEDLAAPPFDELIAALPRLSDFLVSRFF
jgi:hypothetical protein